MIDELRSAAGRAYDLLRLPDGWRLPAMVLLGIGGGLGLFIVHISNAGSYLSDDPNTCVNCHIMAPQYATWLHSAHRDRAGCNDCHVPQDNLAHQYFFKSMDGLRHSAIFTLRREPQVIRIREAGRRVVQANCRRCHGELLFRVRAGAAGGPGERLCWDCHRHTPHGRTASLSSAPNAHVPILGSMIPDWVRGAAGRDGGGPAAPESGPR
ncbi:MAG: cytochrome c nitrite reductase small subunit [Elusimicrobiota bacterium]